jgi:predicted MFS family arabinose efflux permease
VLVLATAHVLVGLALPPFNVNATCLRQHLAPDRLQGRLNAGVTLVTAGAMPLGALTGGVLGEALGLRQTLIVGAVGSLLAVPWLLAASVQTFRAPLELLQEAAPAPA